MPAGFASTPQPPYWAVIFTSRRSAVAEGYDEMSEQMMALALGQPGCLGAEHARGTDGVGVTVSYWRDQEAIAEWKSHASHAIAQRLGRERWYDHYELRIAKVERAYSGPARR